MSAPTTVSAPSAVARSRSGRTGDEPRARFRDLVAAEWIKLWSLRSIRWAFLAGALIVLWFNVDSARWDYQAWTRFDAEQRAMLRSFGALRDAFTDPAAMVLMLAMSAIGAITVVGEFGTGLIRTTFAAVPARRSVMAAKAVVVTLVMTVFGTFLAGVSFWLTQAILSGRGVGLSITDPGSLRLIVSSALLAPVSALAGMALGSLIRHAATTVVACAGVLLLLPTVISDKRHWSAVVAHTMPFNAWNRLAEYVVPSWVQISHPWTVSGAWTVYGVWAVVCAALTVLIAHHRDV